MKDKITQCPTTLAFNLLLINCAVNVAVFFAFYTNIKYKTCQYISYSICKMVEIANILIKEHIKNLNNIIKTHLIDDAS